MPLSLQQLNTAPLPEALALLDGVYEHSPWIAQAALAARPFATLAQLKQAMARAVREGGQAAQLALIRAHPELAGKAMVSRALTAESTHEQSKAGLTDCTPEEFTRIQQLNADYNARFGFPFILAVRGPRGTGLSKQQIIDTFARLRIIGPQGLCIAQRARRIQPLNQVPGRKVARSKNTRLGTSRPEGPV